MLLSFGVFRRFEVLLSCSFEREFIIIIIIIHYFSFFSGGYKGFQRNVPRRDLPETPHANPEPAPDALGGEMEIYLYPRHHNNKRPCVLFVWENSRALALCRRRCRRSTQLTMNSNLPSFFFLGKRSIARIVTFSPRGRISLPPSLSLISGHSGSLSLCHPGSRV